MNDVTLYHAIPSRGMIVKWMLEELGVKYTEKVLVLDKQEHKTPAFLAMNPMGRVPVLTHGDQVITESAAICAYLAETFPEKGLDVPPGSPLRGQYLRWLFFAPASAEPSILWQAIGAHADGDYAPYATVEDVADTLRKAVRDREFIVGDHFTTADILIGSTIFWGLNLMPVLPPHPELVEYWSRLAKREAWQRASGD